MTNSNDGRPPQRFASSAAGPASATRIAAMLDRWEAEDVSGEPEWNVDDLAPLRLGPGLARNRKPPR